MFLRIGILLILLNVCGIGCEDPKVSALRVAHRVGVHELRSELLTLSASSVWQTHDIPKEAWPDTVRKFNPLAVQRHFDGILLVLKRSGSHQSGLLVMLDPKADPGAGGSGAGYDWLEEGLFWCWEKIRTPVPQHMKE